MTVRFTPQMLLECTAAPACGPWIWNLGDACARAGAWDRDMPGW